MLDLRFPRPVHKFLSHRKEPVKQTSDFVLVALKMAQKSFKRAKENDVIADSARRTNRLSSTTEAQSLHSLGFRDNNPEKLFIEVLGPVPTKMSGSIEFICFPGTEQMESTRKPNEDPPAADSSHTRNGHSLVLKLHFGKHSFLFGGDLNIPAQCHLLDHFGEQNPFRSDVQKACHHGSSDFHVDYLKQVKPQANVISSGDNKTFDHPVADAMGALGKHTTGNIPLMFSTELARAVPKDPKKRRIHYGLINTRSNGTILTMAQMKESHKNRPDVWDSFTVPYKGRFADKLNKKQKTKRLK